MTFVIEIIVAIFAFFVVGLPWLLGLYLIYVGMRFKRSTPAVDQTAFWMNWLAFVWLCAERSIEIVAAMPFFSKDLSETFGVKDDDGRVT